MTIHQLKAFLIWSSVINYAVLFLWFFAFAFLHGWMYRLHTRWFKLTEQQFDGLHYAGMAVYKVGILLLNLVPLLALLIIS